LAGAGVARVFYWLALTDDQKAAKKLTMRDVLPSELQETRRRQ